MIQTRVMNWFRQLNCRLDLQYFIRRYNTGAVSIDQMPPNIACVFRTLERTQDHFTKLFGLKFNDAQNSKEFTRKITAAILKPTPTISVKIFQLPTAQDILIQPTEINLLGDIEISPQ